MIKAELLGASLDEGFYSDLTVVNAARVSFDKQVDTFDPVKDTKLINYLAKHGHWTPFSHVRETFDLFTNKEPAEDVALFFENLTQNDLAPAVWKYKGGGLRFRTSLYGLLNIAKKLEDIYFGREAEQIKIELAYKYPVCSKAFGLEPARGHLSGIATESDPDFIDVTFRETVPLFLARQRFKHMIGFTYNEVSRRYVDSDPEFYEPDVWRSRPENGMKQGSGANAVKYSKGVTASYQNHLEQSQSKYESMIHHQVAPEQARMVLPQSMLTSYWVTGSLTAFARAYKLRIDAHAQKEIRDLAVQWDEALTDRFGGLWKNLIED